MREIIIKANPDIEKRLVGGEFYQIDDKITLADVLIALEKKWHWYAYNNNKKTQERMFKYFSAGLDIIKLKLLRLWFFEDNNLNNQSSETISWLLGVLDN